MIIELNLENNIDRSDIGNSNVLFCSNLSSKIKWLLVYSLGLIRFLRKKNIFSHTLNSDDGHLKFPTDTKK